MLEKRALNQKLKLKINTYTQTYTGPITQLTTEQACLGRLLPDLEEGS